MTSYSRIIEANVRLQDESKVLKQEIERLSTDKEQLTSLVNSCQEEIRKLKDQLQQKENIIKEVREYINHYETIRGYFEYEELGYDEYNYEEDLKKELLEILDKGE